MLVTFGLVYRRYKEPQRHRPLKVSSQIRYNKPVVQPFKCTCIGYELGQKCKHYRDVIMGAMASQITSLAIVYATVYSGTDQRKQQSSASLAFVRGIHRGPVNSLHKWPVTGKMSPFGDVIMNCAWRCACTQPEGIYHVPVTHDSDEKKQTKPKPTTTSSTTIHEQKQQTTTTTTTTNKPLLKVLRSHLQLMVFRHSRLN